MNPIIIIAIISVMVWFWFDSLRSQETAKAICKQVCTQLHLQLLDDTVTLMWIRLKRDSHGKLGLQRTYYFEFYDGGDSRQQGVILMQGIIPELLELPGYFNRTISPV